MDMVAQTKVCKKCGETKSVDEFRLRKEKYRNNTYFYREPACRLCELEANRLRAMRYNRKFKSEISKKRKERYASDPVLRKRAVEKSHQRYLKHKESINEKTKQWRIRNAAKRAVVARRHHLKSKYGLSHEQYLVMLKSQIGCCAICHAETDESGVLHVDHCHETGAIRGLLCRHCNTGIGQFRDNIDLLLNAIGYLKVNTHANPDGEITQ